MDTPTILQTTYSISMTMSDDDIHPITMENVPFYEVNFHGYTQDLLYGDGQTMAAKLLANDVASFRNGNLRDFYFQNSTAGNNGQVVAVATVPTTNNKKYLKF